MKSFRAKLNLFLVVSWMNFRTSDYKTFVGALWSFMGPVLSFLITYFLFEGRFGAQIPNYRIHLLCAIIALNIFKVIVNHTIPFMENSRQILLYSNVPSEILLVASMVVPCTKFLVEMTVCLVISVLIGAVHASDIPMIYLLCLGFIPLSLGFGLIMLTLNSFAGDVREIWDMTSPMLYFVSPIIYTLDMLSPWARMLVRFLNPVSPYILCFQKLITGQPTPYTSGWTIVQAFLYSAVFFAIGYASFKAIEKQRLEQI